MLPENLAMLTLVIDIRQKILLWPFGLIGTVTVTDGP